MGVGGHLGIPGPDTELSKTLESPCPSWPEIMRAEAESSPKQQSKWAWGSTEQACASLCYLRNGRVSYPSESCSR